MMVENRLLQGRRQGIGIRNHRRFEAESKQWSQQFLNLLSRDLWNCMRKNKSDARTNRLLSLVLYNRSRVIRVGANRNVPQPFVFWIRPTIQEEDDLVIFNLDICDHAAVARLR